MALYAVLWFDQAMPSALHDYDKQLASLRERYPGWRIWYVPCSNGPTTWHAHQLPVLNCATAEDLAGAMTATAPEL